MGSINLRNEFNKATMPQRIFVFSMLALWLYTFIAIIFTKGQSFYILLHSDSSDTFMDFFNSLHDGEYADPYRERKVIYPAFCYLFYKAFSMLLPSSEHYSPYDWRFLQSGMVVFLALTVITCILIYLILKPRKVYSYFDKLLPIVIILGSVPFLYAYERGNLILQTVLFILVFIRFYNSENKILKELALISLAVAACMKIYPALFGFLLIREKKWKDAIRCMLYGIVLFILPFFYFNGLDSISVMLQNIQETGIKMNARGYGYKVNIGNTIGFLEEILDIPIPNILAFIFLALCVAVVLFLSKENWKIQAAIASIMIIFVDFSYTYTLVYMVAPLISFFESRSERRRMDGLYAALFVCMFAPFPFGGYNPFGLDPDVLYPLGLTTFVQSIALVIFVILLAVDTVIAFTKSENNNKDGLDEAKTCRFCCRFFSK